MPGQDLAFDCAALVVTEATTPDTGKVFWLFRRTTKGIRGLFYMLAEGDRETAALWQKHSARYAEAISQAWEAGDEDRLDAIAEEIEHAIEEERQSQDEEGRTISRDYEAITPRESSTPNSGGPLHPENTSTNGEGSNTDS